MTTKFLPLNEVCDINPRMPRDHGVHDATEVSFVPMASVDELGGVIAERQCRPFGAVKKGYTSFRDGDVLFAKITPCMENGKAAIARGLEGGLGFGSTEFHVLRARDAVIPEWLHYFVRRDSFRREAKRNFTGTAGQQRVPTTFMAGAKIPVPPVDEQRRIVDLLSRSEGILRLRREAQAKAQAIIPALFIDMFGDPRTNPMGWPVFALGEALRAADYGSSTKASASGAGLPLIRMGNVTYAGDLALSDLKYVELKPAEADRFRLECGDLLFNRTNSKELVGKTGLWESELDAVAASYFIRLRANEAMARPFYLWAFMNSRHMKRVLFDTARGAIGQANINSKELKAFRLPLPPLNVQSRFEERCRSILGIVAQQSYALTKAEATFQSLLARTFSSKLAAAEAVPEEAAVA
jgi:type I restriction enzyme, S subunit